MATGSRNTPRILLTGSAGQLATELQLLLQSAGELFSLNREECDLANPESIRRTVRRIQPAIIINSGAYTAVNEAETHQELARAINAIAPGVLAEEARQLGALLIHYSTDYVFDGNKSGLYVEEDIPAPLNVYGATKLEGEREVARYGGRYLIFRTSWVYAAHGKNFLRTILRLAREREELKIVEDQVGSPTSAREIARATARILACKQARVQDFSSGIYHMTCDGLVSWWGFAKAILEGLPSCDGLKLKRLLPITSSEYPAPAIRPFNSGLSNVKFERTFGFRLAHWREALAEVLKELESRKGTD